MLKKFFLLKLSVFFLASVVGLGIDFSHSMKMESESQKEINSFGRTNKSDDQKKKDLQKRKRASKSIPEYRNGVEITDMTPFEVWHCVFEFLGTSINSFAECCKSWNFIVDDYYKGLNEKNKYSMWDENNTHTAFSQRMVYFSNKKFYKTLYMYHILSFKSDSTREKEFQNLYRFIMADTYFLKRDNIIKSSLCLLKEHKNDLFYLRGENNQKNNKFKDRQIKILNRLKAMTCDAPNQQEHILYNYILKLAAYEGHLSHLKEFDICFDKNTSSNFSRLLRNNEELKKLRQTLSPSAEDWQRIIELDDYPTLKDFKMAALACQKAGKFTEAVDYWKKYLSGRSEEEIALLESVMLSFEGAGKLEELPDLWNQNLNISNSTIALSMLRKAIKECFEAGKFEKVIEFALERDKKFNNQLTSEDRRVVAAASYALGKFEDAIKLYNVILGQDKRAMRPDDLLKLADSYYQTEELDLAVHFIEQYITVSGDNETPEALRTAAKIFYKKGQFDLAADLSVRALNTLGDKETAEDLLIAMRSCYEVERFEDTINLYLYFLEKFNVEENIYDLLKVAHAYCKTGKFEIAANSLYSWVIDFLGENATGDDLRLAAYAFEKVENFYKSSHLYARYVDKLGMNVTPEELQKAGELFFKAELFERAADFYKRYAEQLGNWASTQDLRMVVAVLSKTENFEETAHYAGKLIQKLGYYAPLEEILFAYIVSTRVNSPEVYVYHNHYINRGGDVEELFKARDMLLNDSKY